jgi:hypothetical protein
VSPTFRPQLAAATEATGKGKKVLLVGEGSIWESGLALVK